jgi:hypothetical protein
MRKLHAEDFIYYFWPGVLGIVLPGVDTGNAYRTSARVKECLRDASGASTRFLFDLHVFNYPEHVSTARELEEAPP